MFSEVISFSLGLRFSADELDTLQAMLSMVLEKSAFGCNKGNILLFSQRLARQNDPSAWSFEYPVIDATLQDGNFRHELLNTADYKSEALTRQAISAVVDGKWYSSESNILVSNGYNVLVLESDEGRFIASCQIVASKGKIGQWDDCEWDYEIQLVVLNALAQILAELRPYDRTLVDDVNYLLRCRECLPSGVFEALKSWRSNT